MAFQMPAGHELNDTAKWTPVALFLPVCKQPNWYMLTYGDERNSETESQWSDSLGVHLWRGEDFQRALGCHDTVTVNMKCTWAPKFYLRVLSLHQAYYGPYFILSNTLRLWSFRDSQEWARTPWAGQWSLHVEIIWFVSFSFYLCALQIQNHPRGLWKIHLADFQQMWWEHWTGFYL